jgi:peptidoglycan hydrolase CwlO-like protein
VAALKAKQNLELELSDVQQQLEDVMKSKSDLEDRILAMSRAKADLSNQVLILLNTISARTFASKTFSANFYPWICHE